MKLSSSFLYWNARSVVAWGLALIAFAYFASTNSHFLNAGNIYALIQQVSTLMLVASGLALVMLAAEFDLSVAGTFPLAGLVAVQSANTIGIIPAIGLAMLVGVLFGIVNGWLTARFRLPSLAVTVATMVLAIGIGFAVTGSNVVKMTNYDGALFLTQRVLGVFSVMSLIQIVIAVLAYLYIRSSWRGRYIYAVGSNAARARASGLPVTMTLVVAFVGCALFSSIAGALQGISLATGQAGSDDGFLLQCATAALIGGVALTGGRGSLAGVFGGAMLLALVNNGLGLGGIDSAIIELVNGIVLAAVIVLDKPLTRLIERGLRSELPPTVPQSVPSP